MIGWTGPGRTNDGTLEAGESSGPEGALAAAWTASRGLEVVLAVFVYKIQDKRDIFNPRP